MRAEAGGMVDWQRVEALFPDLLDLPPAQRPAFLDRHCGSDGALRAELESLLAAAGGSSTLDRAPALSTRAAAAAEISDEPAGARIGVWRIERLLGRGGMGEVYLATRAEGGFEQQAAIKLVRTDAAQHADRFEAERRILAQLDHPHIAHLLDGGVTAAGRPYMAMEYVVGQNLRDWCMEHKPGLAQRLALFGQVCSAVAYAHANLVIHRDLKPSNILVTRDGQAKLLDFGVAKLLGPLTGETTLTAPLTPDHAAPEQLQGRPATTAVDIYALGVVLYELLSGLRPWSFSSTALSIAVEKLLLEEPRSLSRAAAENPQAPVEPRLLRGDLEAIVAKCLRKTPAHRYATVEALLLDLEHHRRHEPVSARGRAWNYVARRFLRRYRSAVAAAAAATLALAGGLAVALWQARVAQREAQRADYQKEFLLSLFREQDPLARTQANARTPRQLIADGVSQADALAAGAPRLSGELLSALGGVQVMVDTPQTAAATLARALDLQQRQLDPQDPELARTRDRLAGSYINADRWAEARALLEQAIPVLALHYGAHDIRTGEAQNRMVRVLLAERKMPEALALARQVHADYAQALGARHRETLARLFSVATLLDQSDQFEEAERVLRECVAGLAESVGPEHLRLVYPSALLADVLRRRGAHDEAGQLLERALGIARAQLDAQHPLVAQIGMRYGDLLRRQRRYPEALQQLQNAEAVLAAPGSSASPGHLAQARLYLGGLHRDRGDYAQAEAALRRAEAGFRESMGEASGMVWLAQTTLGEVLYRQNRVAEAEARLRDTLAANLALGQQGDAMLAAETRAVLALVLRSRGALAQAAELDRAAYNGFREIYGENHASTIRAAAALALDLVRSGSAAALAEAGTLLQAALAQPALRDQPATQAGLLLVKARAAEAAGAAADAAAARSALAASLAALDAPVAQQVRADYGS